MQITTKTINDSIGNTEIRYFAVTDDNFDGTARGYGYKSLQKLKKAYWFYQNKDKIRDKQNKAKKFLDENPQIKQLLGDYFSEQNYLYALKDGEEITMESFLMALDKDNLPGIIKKLCENKDIWRVILKLIQIKRENH